MDDEALVFGTFRLVPARRALLDCGSPVRIGSRALDLLITLATRAGEIIGKDELIARTWPTTTVVEANLRDVIAQLRRALGKGRAGIRFIENIPGRGYCFVCQVTHERLLEDAVRPPQRARALPTLLTPMIGRDDSVRSLTSLLGRRRIVCVVGEGGIGKTTVAIATAKSMADLFADGAVFVDLAPLADSSLVVSTVASSIDAVAGSGGQASDLVTLLRSRQMLLVLDNCEHVIEAAASLTESLIRGAPGITILATSRETLRCAGEQVYRLRPLALPPADASLGPAEALEYSAVSLFVERMSAAGVTFSLTDAVTPIVIAVCRQLDGIPLAIELAAASVELFGLRELADHLAEQLGRVARGRRTAPPRQRTLRATLDWSFGLLAGQERLILARLAVFSGGFTFDAARAVVAAPPLSEIDVSLSVVGLFRKSLISMETTGDIVRYSLLATVRAYAQERLADSGDLAATQQNHARFYLEYMRQAQTDLSLAAIEGWLVTHRQEIDNLRAALDWAFSERGDPALAVALAVLAIPLMADLSLVAESQRQAERALRLATDGVAANPRVEMNLLTALQATRIYTQGPSQQSMAAWERVLRLATKLEDPTAHQRAIWGLWNDNVYAGAPAEALRFAEHLAENPEAIHRLRSQRVMAISLHYMGNQPEARSLLTQFLAQYSRPDHRVSAIGRRTDHAIVSHATLVRILWLQGEPDTALDLCNRTAQEALAADYAHTTLYVLGEAAVPLALAVGDDHSARRHLDILIRQAARTGYQVWSLLGRCLHEVLRIRQREHGGHLGSYIDAIDALRASGFCAQLPMLAGLLAEYQSDAGDRESGLRSVDAAIGWSGSRELHWYGPELLRIKAEIVAHESSAAADALLGRSIDWAARQGALAWELRSATSLARSLRRQGHSDQALAALAPIYQRFGEGFGTADLIAARSVLDELPATLGSDQRCRAVVVPPRRALLPPEEP